MSLRPGSANVGQVAGGNSVTKMIPFVASFDDKAVIELTPNLMRVWVGDALVTRAAVSTGLPNFDSGAWALSRTGVASITADGAGLAIWNLNSGATASATCPVSVAPQDQATEHAVRFFVIDGPIKFQIGLSPTDDSIFPVEMLDRGTYSMAFTPNAATIYFTFSSTVGHENFNTLTQTQPQGLQTVRVSTGIAIEFSGPMVLPTPWGLSELTPPARVRPTASADVTFVACLGIQQQQINRYSPTSWSVVLYKPVKGPMNSVPGDQAVLITPSQTSGNCILRSNQPIFAGNDIGTLFRLFHFAQFIAQTLTFINTYTDCIRVTGVSVITTVSGGTIVDNPAADRQFTYSITGLAGGAVVVLERSYEGPTTSFVAVKTITANVTNFLMDDGLNNEITWYRLNLTNNPGNVAVGCAFAYAGGGGAGVCRVTDLRDQYSVDAEILVPFYSSTAAFDWHQSEWGTIIDPPTASEIHEGRLWWAGGDRWLGSASDDYTNFDYDATGDASYIDVQIGKGPIANINWLLSLDNLIGGSDTSIIIARSDAIQSPLTPTNFSLRFSITSGSAPVPAVKLDNQGIHVNQSGRKLFRDVYQPYLYTYLAQEVSNLNPDIGVPGYVGAAIQRNPDTIIHLVRADGQIVCLLLDDQDEVKAFWRKTTNGLYEDVIVLPGLIEDHVYVVVNRNGSRFIEKFARLDECIGGSMCKLADNHYAYSGAPISSFTAPWLAGQTVVAWGDGRDLGPITLNGAGFATIPVDPDYPATVSNLCVGLPYTARFLSTKLAYAAQMGSAVNVIKRVDHIGFVLQNTHCQGLRYGAYVLDPVLQIAGDFSSDFGEDFWSTLNTVWDGGSPLDNLPLTERGAIVPKDTVWAFYDEKKIEFAGDAITDARIYLEAAAPRPATVLAVTFTIQTEG